MINNKILMIKSNEKDKKEKPPQVDYTHIKKELKDLIDRQPYVIKEVVKLTWDGRQFIARIPTEIAEEYHITKENQMLFKLAKPLPDSSEKPILEISLV